MKEKEFGFYPQPLQIEEGAITIDTLPDLGDKVKAVSSGGVDHDWIYPPFKERYHLGVGVQKLPYPSRVFGLPKTHVIKHTEATSDEHIDFHVWVLSFFVGMRLTTTEAGFVDAAPIKPMKLVDFILSNTDLSYVIGLAEDFWTKNLKEPRNAKLIVAVVHALYLGQRPQNLQFEDFIYLYAAIDACYALTKEIRFTQDKWHPHGKRIKLMCEKLDIKVPEWGKPDSGGEHSVVRHTQLLGHGRRGSG